MSQCMRHCVVSQLRLNRRSQKLLEGTATSYKEQETLKASDLGSKLTHRGKGAPKSEER